MSPELEQRTREFLLTITEQLTDKKDLSIFEYTLYHEAGGIREQMDQEEANRKAHAEEELSRMKEKDLIDLNQMEIDYGEEFVKCVRNPVYFFMNYVKKKD